MNIRWSKKVSAEEVYKKTQINSWSQTMKISLMKCFGHLVRLLANTLVKTALEYLNELLQEGISNNIM